MSAAVPFVNCISHMVKTCIRRNFKSHHITMLKIVLTSSSMWSFDAITSMLSTVPEKKKRKKKTDPKAEQFRLRVFTQMKLGDEPVKINADLTRVYGANCLSHFLVCRLTEGSRAGTVSFEDGHRAGHPISVRNDEIPHVTICEICNRYYFSIGTAERIDCDDLNLENNCGEM